MNIGTLTGEIVLNDQMTNVLLRIERALKRMEGISAEASSGLAKNMTMAATVGGYLGNVLANLSMRAISFTKDLVTGSLMAGARLEQLTGVTQFLGERAGYTAKQIDELSANIEHTGITGIESRNAILQLISSHIDLKYAAELSAVAQNMATISGKSSSETYGMIIRAITTLNPQILRGAGFTTTMTMATNDYTTATGKSADMLDAAGKSQVLLTAILKEGAEKSGLYGKSMEYASKQAGSAERAWSQVSEQIGTVLLPITSTAIKAWYQFGSSVRDAVTALKSDEGITNTIRSIADVMHTVIDLSITFGSSIAKGALVASQALMNLPDEVKIFGTSLGEAALAAYAANKAFTLLQTLWTAMPVIMAAVEAQMVALSVVIETMPVAAIAAAVGLLTIAITAWYEASQRKLVQEQELGAVQDTINLAIKQGADVHIKYADAIKYNADKFKELHPDLVKATEAAKAEAAQATVTALTHDELTKAINEHVAAMQKANATSEITNGVWEKTSTRMKLTIETQQALIPMLDQLIATQHELTLEQKNYYDAVAVSQVNTTRMNVEMMDTNKVTLAQVEALRAYGLSEAQIAVRLGTTTAALSKWEAAARNVESATRELADLQNNLSKTDTERAIIANNRAYEDKVRTLDMSLASDQAYADQLRQIRDESNRQEMINMQTLQSTGLHLKAEAAAKERNTFNEMLIQGGRTREELDAQRKVTEAAEAAAKGLGNALVDGANAGAAAYENASMMVRNFYGELVTASEAALKTTRMLNGEMVTAEEAAKRKLAGGSYEVTSQNFDETIKSIQKRKGPSGNVGTEEAYDLARKGYSLQEILQIATNRAKGSRGPLPPPQGPAIPGMVQEQAAPKSSMPRPTTPGTPTTVASLTPPEGRIDGGAGGGIVMSNTFHVNGTAEESAKQISKILMQEVRAGRQMGAR